MQPKLIKVKNLSFSLTAVLLLSSLLQSAFLHAQQSCDNAKPPTFTVDLPLMRTPLDEEEEGQGWDRPDIWNGEPASDDAIEVPNGRPIYALIVSGYNSNTWLDQMMLYHFARYLMSKGAYVHYSWWNNLLAPYMERPLHSLQSYPGDIGLVPNLLHFNSGEAANEKALPGEDYQFLADAKLFLTAIRQNNPNAIIIVAGHSMGGATVVHLATQTNELIDILAPIDPVGNRNFPWAGALRDNERDYNWTRWRASRDNFLGYRKSYNAGTFLNRDCQPTGGWLRDVPAPTSNDLVCLPIFFADNNALVVKFRSNVINLFHRYQQEARFPFDFADSYHFGHTLGPNSISTQMAITTQSDGIDLFGWPDISSGSSCCVGENGIGWPADGHEEIIGNRGPTFYNLGIAPIPLGTRLRTSPQCGRFCTGLDWPARSYFFGWINGNSALRIQKLKELETFTANQFSEDAPTQPQLCKVSQGLIELFDAMNKPPTANPGNDRTVECTGTNSAIVTLNGSASTDPDGDQLIYTWTGPFGSRTGQVTDVSLPMGTSCIMLMVKDPSGHVDKKKVSITVRDNGGPTLNVSTNPATLWPPNHKMVDVNAAVLASDLCGTVQSIVLHSIVASEGANVVGSGNTSPDIAGTSYNTNDLFFQLRAERSGPNKRRIYTITYKATDNAGNSTLRSSEVVVQNPSGITQRSSSPVMNEEVVSKPVHGYLSCYPNPFSTDTKIDYYSPTDAQVEISVYNNIGQLVAKPVNAFRQTGYYSVMFDAKGLSAGIYSCVLRTKVNTVTHKILLLK